MGNVGFIFGHLQKSSVIFFNSPGQNIAISFETFMSLVSWLIRQPLVTDADYKTDSG